MEIREELSQDRQAVYDINKAAFGRPDEAELVERLRAQKAIVLSLVAVINGATVGHVLFSPVTLQKNNGVVSVIAGLGPVAVLPRYQNQGIGKALIEAGIELCRAVFYPAVIVIGHPEYYPRFGFLIADQFGISSSYEVPREVFMVLELQEGALKLLDGVARYHPAFDDV